MTFGAFISTRRKEAKLNLRDTAKHLGMGIASVQNPFTDRNMPYEQPFQPDAGDAEAVPIFVILSPIC